MIKCNDFTVDGYEEGKSEARATLIADTSAEVIAIDNDATNIVGLGDGYILAFGSTCLTVNSEFGVLGSDGKWNF